MTDTEILIPTVNSDTDEWGRKINAFLLKSHYMNGKLRESVVEDVLAEIPLNAEQVEAAAVSAGMMSGEETTAEKAKLDRVRTRQYDVREYAESIESLAVDAGPAVLATHAAMEADGVGGELFFGPAKYLINTNTIITPTVPLVINCNGQVVAVSPTKSFDIRAPVVSTSLKLASPVARYAKTLTLVSAAGVQRGDVLFLTEPTIMETSWGINKLATVRVRSVSGNVVTLTSRVMMSFPITTTDITQYRQAGPLAVRNGKMTFGPGTIGNYTNSRMIRIEGFSSPRLDNMEFSTNEPWVSGLSGGPPGSGVTLLRCVNAQLNGTAAEAIGYVVVPFTSLNTRVTGITAERIRHPVVPTYWSDGVLVSDVITNDAWQTTDSHPAFNVHYRGVLALRDESVPNLRSISGSLRDCVIHSDATDAADGPYIHSVEPVDMTWYDDAELVLDNVQIFTPNRTKNGIAAKYGRVSVSRVIANVGLTGDAAFPSTLKQLTIDYDTCKSLDGSKWPRIATRVAASARGTQGLSSRLASGIHHIDLRNDFLANVSAGRINVNGQIGGEVSTDPAIYTIRVHDNAWPEVSWPGRVWGHIDLTCFLRHSNAGSTDQYTERWNLQHKITHTSAFDMYLAPARKDSPTGQANESLVFALSNFTFEGVSTLGSNGQPDMYFQFDISISSGRTSPVYDLRYDLVLYRQ